PYPPTRLMDKLRAIIRAKQLSYRTEKTYCGWVKDYIRFHKMQHPSQLGTQDIYP
ncbi:MAG: phage integrase N-terminal SAM-like domain-containing protein, partial [Cellvibrionaceae bacterium]|nr:phage integrase N-terminal SAM-like domain-containing protein [Cellvibrionaceae bacterium]